MQVAYAGGDRRAGRFAAVHMGVPSVGTPTSSAVALRRAVEGAAGGERFGGTK